MLFKVCSHYFYKAKISQVALILVKEAEFFTVSLPVSQLAPAYPAAHVQEYELILLLQVAPCLHGLLLHSFISVEQ